MLPEWKLNNTWKTFIIFQNRTLESELLCPFNRYNYVIYTLNIYFVKKSITKYGKENAWMS